MLVFMAKGIKVADAVKFADFEVILHYLGGIRLITWVLKSGRRRERKMQCGQDLTNGCWLWSWKKGNMGKPLEVGKARKWILP